jgi:hypothetical protein
MVNQNRTLKIRRKYISKKILPLVDEDISLMNRARYLTTGANVHKVGAKAYRYLSLINSINRYARQNNEVNYQRDLAELPKLIRSLELEVINAEKIIAAKRLK